MALNHCGPRRRACPVVVNHRAVAIKRLIDQGKKNWVEGDDWTGCGEGSKFLVNGGVSSDDWEGGVIQLI